MGRAGQLSKPELTGAHADLNTALHRLHLLAGRPSLTDVARVLQGAGISRSTIHDAFCSQRLPKWKVIDALVEVLSSQAPGGRPEEDQKALYEVWLRAVQESDRPVTLTRPRDGALTEPREKERRGGASVSGPHRVHALIVGIEQYGAGPSWDLPGPARDAVRFYRLLHAAGVPDDQLRLHLAPLPPYVPDVRYSPADYATLRRVLVRELPSAEGDVLWVWWGGHAVIDRVGHRRLFCADATTADKVTLDLDSALARYAGDAVPGFTEQMWIVDTAANFEDDLSFREPLSPEALPVGQGLLTSRQTLLRAAGDGQAAVNDPVRATGLFSDVVLGLLADQAGVLPEPPDPKGLFTAVQARFATLREAGRTQQHPEIRLQSPERTIVLPLAGLHAHGRPFPPLLRAVEALLEFPLMRDPDARQATVAALDPQVASTLSRHSTARLDTISLLTGLAQHHPDALWDLYDAVVAIDDSPERGLALRQALRELTASVSHQQR